MVTVDGCLCVNLYFANLAVLHLIKHCTCCRLMEIIILNAMFIHLKFLSIEKEKWITC